MQYILAWFRLDRTLNPQKYEDVEEEFIDTLKLRLLNKFKIDVKCKGLKKIQNNLSNDEIFKMILPDYCLNKFVGDFNKLESEKILDPNL